MKKTIVVASILLSASPYLAYGWGTGNAAEPPPGPAVSVTMTTATTALPLGEDSDHPQTERRGLDVSTLAALPYPAIIPTEGR
ncbi:MAG TPA: hypothetical protein VJS40_09635 [Aestuariivirgaceae bacterium]|nr:hypothetical protein [Aestuariivirgaceae bacterium]